MGSLRPYFERPGCVLYHGDCRDVLPMLSGIDAVVTDPPYESMKGGVNVCHPGVSKRVTPTVTVGDELGTADGLQHAIRIARLGAIAFCSFHWISKCRDMLAGSPKGLIAWYKRNSMPSVNNAPHYLTEYAWAVQYAPGIDWRKLRTHYDIPMLQAGCMAAERIVNGNKSAHPTQKPLQLMIELLLPGMDSVLDPFAGTGTTGVACVRTGRNFIGIEIEEKYAAIAAKRLEYALNESPDQLPFATRELFE